jgi:hypothetical protein
MESNTLPVANYSPFPQTLDIKRHGSNEEGSNLLSHSLSGEKDVIEPVYRGTLSPLADRASRTTRTDLTFDKVQKPFGDALHCLRFPILLLTLAIPLIGLIVWYVITAPKVKRFGLFSGLVIGGRFYQSAAKAHDIIYSGLLAPALMTALNFVWFSSARLAIRASRDNLQDQQRRIPLATWVTASGMYTGSYNVKDFLSLRRGRMWRLYCLILLALSTAFSWTTLSNIIAYEAYTEIIPSDIKYKLRTLNDMEIDYQTRRTDYSINLTVVLPQVLFELNLQQQALISGQLINLLNQMATSNSSSLDSEGGYIVINATDSSLADLEPSVVALYDIPAFRLSATCEPVLLRPGSLDVETIFEDVIEMIGIPSSSNTTVGDEIYNYLYPGIAEDLNSTYYTYQEKPPFVLFSNDYQRVVLGYWRITLKITVFQRSTVRLSPQYCTTPQSTVL